MKKPKHPLSRTYDCFNCESETGILESYFAKGNGPYYCDICGHELVRRDKEPEKPKTFMKDGQIEFDVA